MPRTADARFNPSPTFRRLILLLASLNGLVGIRRIVESLFRPEIYNKDFMSPYLMARAILGGVNPYLPLNDLAAIFVPQANLDHFAHPTPHPPLVGLLGLPFGWVGYERGAQIWFGLELVFVGISIALLARWWGARLGPGLFALSFLIAVGWVPLVEDLWFGQLTTLLFLLLLLSWQALREERDGLGGALLGAIFAIKLTAWPLLLLLALRFRWRAVLAAAGVVLAAHGLAAAVLGTDCIRAYYLEVGPQVAAIYRGHDTNFSAWTLGLRLFEGFGNNFRVLPLFAAPMLAKLATPIFPAVLLLAGLWAAVRARSFDTAFGLLVGVGILVSPIAWTHYLMTSLIPAAILLRRLLENGASKGRVHLMFGLMAAFTIAGAGYSTVAQRLGGDAAPGELPLVSFAAGLLTLIPMAALIGLLVLLWRSDAEWHPSRAGEAGSAGRAGTWPWPRQTV
ncbi:MAG: glycosyltransferase family 87 protein [Blastocatellia bacterium]|nr:glycosyltransferase family 87 protein [Blastocatellia bacterium]